MESQTAIISASEISVCVATGRVLMSDHTQCHIFSIYAHCRPSSFDGGEHVQLYLLINTLL